MQTAQGLQLTAQEAGLASLTDAVAEQGRNFAAAAHADRETHAAASKQDKADAAPSTPISTLPVRLMRIEYSQSLTVWRTALTTASLYSLPHAA